MMAVVLFAAFLVAVVISLVAVKWSIRFAHDRNALDFPDGGRKDHAVPIPRLGGAAVAIAFVVTAAGATLVLRLPNPWEALGVLIPALGVALLGLVDDTRHVSPRWRLTLQAAAALVAWFLGTQIVIFGSPWIDLPLFVLWVVFVVNGINLLDNSDGLAASTTLIASMGAGVIAFISGQEVVSLLAMALAGVSIGFLWHNWYPARVYLGDSGAYFLGFLLAVLAVRLRPENVPTFWAALAALLLLILPIADTFFVVLRRLRVGVHPFTAGKDHLSHELQKRGLTTPRAVLALQGLSLMGAFMAIVIVVALG